MCIFGGYNNLSKWACLSNGFLYFCKNIDNALFYDSAVLMNYSGIQKEKKNNLVNFPDWDGNIHDRNTVMNILGNKSRSDTAFRKSAKIFCYCAAFHLTTTDD